MPDAMSPEDLERWKRACNADWAETAEIARQLGIKPSPMPYPEVSDERNGND